MLKKKLPSIKAEPRELHKAMRYSVLNGGKRLRAAIIYATGEAFNADHKVLDSISAAMEILQASSLIIDDLPSFDNDKIRRGKRSCHKVFGEDIAILASISLITLAFNILANLKNMTTSQNALKMIAVITNMIEDASTGQFMDVKLMDKAQSIKNLEMIYKFKTGCVLISCIQLAALAGNCTNKNVLRNLTKFGDMIGLAFQIQDDIVGVESSSKILGKTQGIDLGKKKTYLSIAGMKKAKSRVNQLHDQALIHLKKSGIKADKLELIATYMIRRNF